MLRHLSGLVSAWFLLNSLPSVKGAEPIKLAILAPQGSTWAIALDEVKQEIETKTGGEVSLKIYAGGRQGDEAEVLKKMKINYLDGGGFTGIGLGEIMPSVRMLELPFMWKDYDEVERVLAAMTPEYEKKFAEAGYHLLGWAEGGFVRLFTTEAVTSTEELKKQKMWAWAGDPLSDALFRGFGITPIPLALPNVLQSLQTGLINGAYGPPLIAVALQWQTKVKFMSADEFSYSTAAMLLTKKAWERVGKHQKLVSEIVTLRLKELRQRIRKDNEAARESMVNGGIKMIKMSDAEMIKVRATSKEISTSLIGKLYSEAELKQLQKASQSPAL
jgi:TRAP-type C4-dicarboxylate transport system substrate-binding protein